ncbi:hypothetical protein J6590_038416 [Homalodisca vitripennis]|nr:hypothetical protein J6590_038416 [Homalodisca vitripennis]
MCDSAPVGTRHSATSTQHSEDTRHRYVARKPDGIDPPAPRTLGESSFASKMLNTLIGEGQQEGQQPPEGGQMHQPIFRPQTRPPLRAQGPGGMPPHGMGGPQLMGPQRMPGPGIGPGPGPRMQGPRMEFRPRLGMARPQIGPSHMMQRPPPPVASGTHNLTSSCT